jgi:hypothetical protein
MKHYVYLAGPITGLTYEGATEWRNVAAEKLDSDKIETLSPLRGKNYLLGRGLGLPGGHVHREGYQPTRLLRLHSLRSGAHEPARNP